MANLKSWLNVAVPHGDIADGSFDESLFAADLGLVARGKGPIDYLDPALFAAKTFLTANLRAALVEIGNRLGGDPSAAAVHRMQTEFGGGKTHTLLAAYHLFHSPDKVAHTKLARGLAALLKTGTLPKAQTVVLDGSAMLVDPETMPDGTVVHSFLGHLAWQLGGADGFALIKAQDEGLRGTSTAQMVELLERYSPCLILMDETLEYLNKALEARSHEGSLAATTLTVIKELATAASNVKGACLLATLTSSRMEDYATVAGQEMQERLSKVVGRTESIVTPVEGDDIFPILHTRLFDTVGDPKDRRAVADAYGAYYEQLGDVLPSTFRDAEYRDRIEAAYPFHPELIDILTNRWGSLSGFQRTRGALRSLAHTVKALAQAKHKAPLIHPGDVPLRDAGVRAEVIRFAGESYKAALNADLIRDDSRAVQEDKRRGGEVAANRIAVGLGTTAFLNSFGADRVVGASAPQMLLGVGRPGLSRGVIEDVRDAFKNAAWYMRYEGGRYRFTTDPNLNKVIVEREGAIGEEPIVELLNRALSRVAPSQAPWRVELHVDESSDLPDEGRLFLGVLDYEHTIGIGATETTKAHAQTVLTQRGPAGRTNKNASVLIAADGNALSKARATARTLAAMIDLREDKHRLKRFNEEQREDLLSRIKKYEDRLPSQLVMAYRHVLVLAADTNGSGGVVVDHIDLGPAKVNDTIPARVTEHLKATDRLLDGLAPAALLSERFALVPADQKIVEISKLLDAFHRYPRLPKIASTEVLRTCLINGVQQKVFALASGSAWDADDSIIKFGTHVDPTEVQFQPGTWLIRATVAKTLLEQRAPEPPVSPPPAPPTVNEPPVEGGPAIGSPGSDTGPAPSPPPASADPTRLTIQVNHVPADKARDVLKVAVLPLAAQGATLEINFTITTDAAGGISRQTLDLVVNEGLRQLGVDHNVSVES
ncbi:DUF499 domain-containing protein [Microbispora sp. NPDC088329]|uniref:ATP-binding protein n=1 Tax=Microbispora sp. NPDC088329 TaxID=3154869 RepID=UPI00341772A5